MDPTLSLSPVPAPKRGHLVVTAALRALAGMVGDGQLLHPQRPERPADVYRMPELPPGVVPAAAMAMDTVPLVGEAKRMALDSNFAPSWGLGNSQGFAGGLWFPGYPYLAELTQNQRIPRAVRDDRDGNDPQMV